MTEAVAADFLPILAAEAPRRSFVVSVHDVAPCTREASARIIEALQHAGVRSTSLLVVPNYHREGSVTEDTNFVSWLRDLEARGHEIVIHGYFHERPRHAGERAARDTGMQYTTRIDSVLDLLTGERELTRSLVYSTRSKWRRTVSLGWNAALARSLEMRELARLSIHPPDFEAPKIWDQILQFIQRFARTRNATTYRDWIGRQRTNREAR